MQPKRPNLSSTKRHRKLLKTLELESKRIESLTMETIEKTDRMLDDDLFNQTNLHSIQSLARKSVVSVPTQLDDRMNDDNLNENFHLIIRSNERLEMLVEPIKHEIFLFTQHIEKVYSLIELNRLRKDGIADEIKCLWKSELVQMKEQISSNHVNILNYYQNRGEIAKHIFKQPHISDYWEQLIEVDEDLFFKLRIILYNLRLFNLRLHRIVISIDSFS